MLSSRFFSSPSSSHSEELHGQVMDSVFCNHYAHHINNDHLYYHHRRSDPYGCHHHSLSHHVGCDHDDHIYDRTYPPSPEIHHDNYGSFYPQCIDDDNNGSVVNDNNVEEALPRPVIQLKTVQIDLKASALNQYNTDEALAEQLIPWVHRACPRDPRETLFIEPSAGQGAFYRLLPPNQRIGIDIDPTLQVQFPDYIIGDFLQMTPDMLGIAHIPRPYVVIVGNPPFSSPPNESRRLSTGFVLGARKNLALHFINHAATMADTICFIVGLNFRRKSVQNRINRELHLVYEQQLDGKHDHAGFKTKTRQVTKIKTVFQIWQRRYDARGCPILRKDRYENVPRIVKGVWYHDDDPSRHGDFIFVEPGDARANIAIRRWGSPKVIGDLQTDVHEIVRLMAEEQYVWFFLYAPHRDAVLERLFHKKQRFVEEMHEICTVTAINMNRRDMLSIYLDDHLGEEEEPMVDYNVDWGEWHNGGRDE